MHFEKEKLEIQIKSLKEELKVFKIEIQKQKEDKQLIIDEFIKLKDLSNKYQNEIKEKEKIIIQLNNNIIDIEKEKEIL